MNKRFSIAVFDLILGMLVMSFGCGIAQSQPPSSPPDSMEFSYEVSYVGTIMSTEDGAPLFEQVDTVVDMEKMILDADGFTRQCEQHIALGAQVIQYNNPFVYPDAGDTPILITFTPLTEEERRHLMQEMPRKNGYLVRWGAKRTEISPSSKPTPTSHPAQH